MKKSNFLVSTAAITVLLSAPAFASNGFGGQGLLGDIFQSLGFCSGNNGGHPGSGPSGAPAPVLAAGLPAFAALGGAYILAESNRRTRKSESADNE